MILHATGSPPSRRRVSTKQERVAWPTRLEQSTALFQARNPGAHCTWNPKQGVFRVQVHRHGRVYGPLTAPDLNFLEAALQGRVPGVYLDTTIPPDQLDAARTTELTRLIRSYLHLRDQRTAA